MAYRSHTAARYALPIAVAAFLAPALSSQAPMPSSQAPAPVTQPAAINQSSDRLLASFRFRSIGPASMGGRIDDIAVSETDPSIIYIGYAVGGVFKSDNNGTTFRPVFETYGTASIGDIAIHPTNPDIVYVGTGEPNNRQTSSFGDGIYKTADGGKTFTNVGLRDTQTIARIVIDPRNPETVYVASPGHLFGPNPERGIFKTTDGGKSWNKVKFIDDDTGFTDIAIDPSNSNVLYAASYQRRRSGCCFNGGGPGSGLWKTTDAGKTWTKLTANGLPPGTYGRIALDVSRSNPNVVYVQIEAGNVGQPTITAPNDPGANTEATPPGAAAVPSPAGNPPATQQAGGRSGAAQQPQTAPASAAAGGGGTRASNYNWCNNAGPSKGFPVARGGQPVPASNQTPPPLDAGRGGIFKSENKGAGWVHMSNCNSRPMYFSQLRVDPTNDKAVYVAGLPVAKSLDGGKTFATLDDAGGYGAPGHVDQHAIWIDPKNPKHLMIGNDGGLNITWDQGKTWDYVNTMATALAYWVSADMRRPYYVYTGLQDNGSWGGPSATRSTNGIMNSDWFGMGGGDGFQTAVDPTDYNVVYTESQDGNTSRYDLRSGRGQVSIRPRPPASGGRGGRGAGGRGGTAQPAGQAAAAGAQATEQAEAAPPAQFGGRGAPNVLNASPGDQYRFNWNTPFMLSPHNPSIVWLGGNRLFKSLNRGETWTTSMDLTKQIDRNKVSLMSVPGDRTQLSKNDGVVAYSTIISVSESPVLPGVVWAGTDDGNLQVSKDAGVTFTEVGKNLPGLPANHGYWVSRVDASHFDAGTAYVSVDGHRDDDLKPYVFVTRDYGQTWTSIVGDLPAFGNVQVIREDPKNRNLLFAGTEFGLYISLDGGNKWEKFMNNLPTARVDDILVHPRDNDLIVATHARGIWITDDISPLQQLGTAPPQDVALFDVRPAVAYLSDRQSGQQVGGQKVFVGENPQRGAAINYYLPSAAVGEVKITIADATGRVVRMIVGTRNDGINRVTWNLTAESPAAETGGRGLAATAPGGAPTLQPVPVATQGFGRGGAASVDAGTYLVTLTANGKTVSKPVQVLQDVWLREK
jgi:photosystem II stability/assembly factor-like uncharacterized protein